MSNRKNKYINKDDTPVSTKTMRTVLIILYLCSILYFFMLFVNLKKLFMARNNEKTPKIKAVIHILLTGVILILLRNIVYISHKISKFIENNLLFKI